NPAQDSVIRLEALSGIGGLRAPDAVDALLDLLSEPSAAVRGATLRALSRVDPEAFVTTVAASDPDKDWTVRAELASALAGLPGAQAAPALTQMLKDQ